MVLQLMHRSPAFFYSLVFWLARVPVKCSRKRNSGFSFSHKKPRVLIKTCGAHVGMALNFVAGVRGGDKHC